MTFFPINYSLICSIFTLSFIVEILQETGFFFYIIRFILPLGMDKGRRLCFLFGLLIALTTPFLTNYGSILFWTPVVIETLKILKFSIKKTLVYLIITGFIAEISSVAFPFSNPVNQITVEIFDISFIRYFLVMIPVQTAILISSLGILWFYFDPHFPKQYPETTIPMEIVNHPLLLRGGIICFGLAIIGTIFHNIPGIIMSVIILITLIFLEPSIYPNIQKISLSKTIKKLPFLAILISFIFSIFSTILGEFLLIDNLSKLFDQLAGWGITLASLGTGFLAMFLSALTHNLPTIVNHSLALQQAEITNLSIAEAMIYASIIGCTLGAKLTPIASISTLIWFNSLKQQGFKINLKQYFRVHLIIIIPLLFLSLLFLVLWLPWLIISYQ